MSESDNDYRPTVNDVDPSALAVNSVDDNVRVSADPSESEIVNSAGETLRVDDESDGDRVLDPEDTGEGQESGGEGPRGPVEEPGAGAAGVDVGKPSGESTGTPSGESTGAPSGESNSADRSR